MDGKVKIEIYAGTQARKLEDGGHEMVGYVVEVDADWLRSMGGRAAGNVNGKAVRGGVTARVINRRKI